MRKKQNNKFVINEGLARLRLLRRVRGPNKRWRERDGRVYAVEIQIEEKGKMLNVILTGKGGDRYMGMTATHSDVVYYANNFGYPILKALRIKEGQYEFYFFRARDFVEHGERLSKWKCMIYLDYEKYKIPWDPLDYILDTLL